MRMGWWCWQGRECTAPEFTAPALCPQEMRSARRPTSGLSNTQVSSTTRFHRAPGLGRQASPSLTPDGWEEAAGRPAGRPDAQCCCHCVLPGTAQDSPPAALPHLRGSWCWRHRHLHLPAWGCHPNHWPEDGGHIPLGCGTRVRSGRFCTPHHSISPIAAAPQLPLPSSALVPSPPQLAPGPTTHTGPQEPLVPQGWCRCLCPQRCPGVAPTPSLSCNFISSIKL